MQLSSIMETKMDYRGEGIEACLQFISNTQMLFSPNVFMFVLRITQNTTLFPLFVSIVCFGRHMLVLTYHVSIPQMLLALQ